MRCSLKKRRLHWYKMADHSSQNMIPQNESSKVEESHYSYGPSEEEQQLLRALKRTHTERFKVMTKLIKMNLMFSKAKISHQPINDTDQPK